MTIRYITTALVHMTLKSGVHGDKNKGQAPVPPQNAVLPPNTLFPADMDEDDILELGVPKRAFRAVTPGENIRTFAEMTDLSMIPSEAERNRAARIADRVRLDRALEVERQNVLANQQAAQQVTHVNGIPVEGGTPTPNVTESAAENDGKTGRASRRTATAAKTTADVAEADAAAAEEAAKKAEAEKAAAEKAAADKAAADKKAIDDGL